MSNRGEYTYQEIMSQPDVWQQTLALFASQSAAFNRFWQAAGAEEVIFTGCGSTYYLSLAAAAMFQSLTGVPARAYPASELLLFPGQMYPAGKRLLLMAVSRSGETTETIQAVNGFQQQYARPVLAVTCDSHSPLAQMADFTLAIDAADEQSVAQTRSFASMYLLTQALAAEVAGKDPLTALAGLPAACAALLQQVEPLMKQLGENANIERFFFLGSSYQHGLAREAMLKMKEMSLSYSEAFHMLEFRHGPMSMVNDHSLVAGLVNPAARSAEQAVLRQMHKMGAQVLALQDEPINQPGWFGVELPSGLADWALPLLCLPPLQLLAYYRSMSRGLNPDNPENLTAVVELDTI